MLVNMGTAACPNKPSCYCPAWFFLSFSPAYINDPAEGMLPLSKDPRTAHCKTSSSVAAKGSPENPKQQQSRCLREWKAHSFCAFLLFKMLHSYSAYHHWPQVGIHLGTQYNMRWEKQTHRRAARSTDRQRIQSLHAKPFISWGCESGRLLLN